MVEECLGTNMRRFSVSPTAAVMYEVVFFIYVILMFFSKNMVLNVAFMNLINVLKVPFAYIGLRYFHSILSGKFNSKVASFVLIAVLCVVLSLFFGGSIFTFAALFGASSVTKEMISNQIKK